MLAASAGRVLIVDDSQPLLENLGFVLELEGFQVSTAQGGGEGFEKLSTEEFDVILMDCRMPEIEGPELCRRIRAGNGPNRSAPIIGMSINGAEKWEKKCRDAGMNRFIEKSGDIEDLLVALNMCIGPSDYRGS